jgi:DNA-binding NarL/FixJ family response regulator
MTRRILFVDDEQKILDGLNRMLRPLRNEWEMAFSLGGSDALNRFEQEPFDVVVSDMRMPGMNGDEFLTEVRRRYPRTLRVVLTGEAHRDSMIRVIRVAHRVLTKPLDADKLKDVIRRSSELRNLLKNPILEELINRVKSVPSPPKTYARVVEVLESQDWSIEELGRILADDIGVAAKLVQLANSSLFGLRWSTSNVEQAVQVLGTETTKSLCLAAGLITRYDPAPLAPYSLGDIWSHSRDVGTAAARLERVLQPQTTSTEAGPMVRVVTAKQPRHAQS